LRIYPLYWIALALFILGFSAFGTTRFSLADIVIHVVGAQALLSPQFVVPLLTLWFVGVLLLYYLLYVVIAILSYNPKYMFSAIVGLFVMFVLLRITFGIIDSRFFLYYGIFVAGILVAKYDLLYKKAIKDSSVFVAIALFIVAITAVSLLTNPVLSSTYSAFQGDDVPIFSISSALAIILFDILALSFVYVVFNATRRSIPSMTPQMHKLIFLISFSTYCVYLFHRPFLTALTLSLQHIHLTVFAEDLILIAFGLPLLFLLSYLIQSEEDTFIAKAKMKLRTKAIKHDNTLR
jgi:peptidoglycan/LPS O-acetylase OafA/YrhL